MEEKKIDTIKLIQEVKKYRSLWDQTSLDYLNRALKIKNWALVALKMDCPVAEVKSQWKKLKDNFVQELRKAARSGQPSNWVYFDSMYFFLKGLNILLLPNGISQSSNEINSSCASPVSCDNESSENSSGICNEKDPESSQRKKVKFNPENTSVIVHSTPYQPIPDSRFPGSRVKDNNDDYYFLMSLLPSFQSMSDQQKLFLKIKIMQDVYEASYGESLPNHSTNSSSGIDTSSSGYISNPYIDSGSSGYISNP